MKILTIMGTRPEAIKMAPLLKAIEKSDDLNGVVCSTGQHQEMLTQVTDFFDLTLDYQLNLMTKNQSLSHLTSNLIKKIPYVLNKEKPDLVLVHGDTATTFAGSFASFLEGIDVGHVEAGLRSKNINLPWPEEANRRLTSVISKYHFAPTIRAKNLLLKENIEEKNIIVTGNTVVDALFEANKEIEMNISLNQQLARNFKYIEKFDKFILVTIHRRESFGSDLIEICCALRDLSKTNSKISLVIPVHLNPNVRGVIYEYLNDIHNIFLIEPLDYPSFVYLMKKCYFILTDSGGVQEEAPSFGKPVLVLRDVTERPEGIEAGCLELVGTSKSAILDSANELLFNNDKYNLMSKVNNPYGDGLASQRIINYISSIRNEY